MTVGERIRERRKSLGTTADELAIALGVSRSTIFRYENGSIEKFPVDILEPIAAILSTTPAYLMGWTDNPIKYDDGDMLAEIPLTYMLACDNDPKRAAAMMRAVDVDAKNEKLPDNKPERSDNIILDKIPYIPGRRVPILGSIHAGVPAFAVENIDGYDYADVPENEDYFFLRVKGDSMINAHIFNGDLVLVKSQTYAENGQIVVCLVNGDEATLKRFYKNDGTIVLQPENPTYQPIIIPQKDLASGYARIIGIAKEVKHKL